MKSLPISLYNRPEYTKQLLNHLNMCYDVENYKITICCEPVNEEVISLAKNFRPDQTEVVVNPRKLGCNTNIFQCLAIGFNKSDYHIHLEDDTIPGKDALLYFDWCRKYSLDDNIMNISGYVNSFASKEKYYFEKNYEISKVKKRSWFVPWGWATWKDRFQDMKQKWDFIGKRGSWDVTMNTIIRDGKSEIFPLVSRIQNIGGEMGTHVPNVEWHKLHHYNEHWIDSCNLHTRVFEEK